MAPGVMTYVQADVISQRSDDAMKDLCVYKDSRRSEFVAEILSLSLSVGVQLAVDAT